MESLDPDWGKMIAMKRKREEDEKKKLAEEKKREKAKQTEKEVVKQVAPVQQEDGRPPKRVNKSF